MYRAGEPLKNGSLLRRRGKTRRRPALSDSPVWKEKKRCLSYLWGKKGGREREKIKNEKKTATYQRRKGGRGAAVSHQSAG